MRDPRRWLILLAIAATVGFLLIRRVPAVKTPHSACMGDSDCLRAERCYVVPEESGFATFGLCADPCADDGQCGGLKCVEVAAGESYVGPSSAAKKIGEGHARVCVKP